MTHSSRWRQPKQNKLDAKNSYQWRALAEVEPPGGVLVDVKLSDKSIVATQTPIQPDIGGPGVTVTHWRAPRPREDRAELFLVYRHRARWEDAYPESVWGTVEEARRDMQRAQMRGGVITRAERGPLGEKAITNTATR